MAEGGQRTMDTMMAELVHHMAELVKQQEETNRLLGLLTQAKPVRRS